MSWGRGLPQVWTNPTMSSPLGGCRAATPAPRGPRPGSASQHRPADGSPGLQHGRATSEPPRYPVPPLPRLLFKPSDSRSRPFLTDPRHIALCLGNLIRLNRQNAT